MVCELCLSYSLYCHIHVDAELQQTRIILNILVTTCFYFNDIKVIKTFIKPCLDCSICTTFNVYIFAICKGNIFGKYSEKLGLSDVQEYFSV